MLLVMVQDMGIEAGNEEKETDSDGRSFGSCVSFAAGLGRSRERRKERRKRKADKKGEKKELRVDRQTRGRACKGQSEQGRTAPYIWVAYLGLHVTYHPFSG